MSVNRKELGMSDIYPSVSLIHIILRESLTVQMVIYLVFLVIKNIPYTGLKPSRMLVSDKAQT